jgi:hypothetical protein
MIGDKMGSLRGLHAPEDAEDRAAERHEKKVTDDLWSDFMTMSDLCYDFLCEQRCKFIEEKLDPLVTSLGLTRLGPKTGSENNLVPGYSAHRVLYSGPENCIIIVDIGVSAHFTVDVVSAQDVGSYPESVETALRILSRVAAMSSPFFKEEPEEITQS